MNSPQAVTGWRSGSIQKACCRFSIMLKWGEKEIKLNKHQKCMLECKCKLYLFKGLLSLLNYSSLKKIIILGFFPLNSLLSVHS